MTTKEFAKLHSVTYDRDTDEVFVTFKVNDPSYKDFALRISQRDDIKIFFRGEKLEFEEEDEDAII